MTIAEREAAASAYIAKCARRRERISKRRARMVKGIFRFLTPFAAGICAIGVILAMV